MQANLGLIIAIIVAIVVVIWVAIRLLSSSFIKTLPTAAFVRTGGLFRGTTSKPLVVVNGAAWVFGFLHRIKWVSLETMALEVRHSEDRALVTNDPQYVDFEGRFFIRVGQDVVHIDIAARTIGGETVDEPSVRRLAEPKINGAVRDVAASFDLKTLLEKRAEFIKQLQERLRPDLAENGLILESVSILTLRPTLEGHYSTEDLLGAQVARANAAVIEQALTEKNRLEKQGSLERARQDAQATRERMGIEEEVERERAQRNKNIALVLSAEEAEAKIAQEKKREEAERIRITTERALQAEAIENERQEMLLRERLQKDAETERVLREQAVVLSEQERERLLAEATAQKLAAVKQQIEADSEREQALQDAMTLAEKAEAERQAEIELINARLEADKLALENKNQVEIEARRLQDMAEAERTAATAQAEAIRIRAQAELDAAKLAAIADRKRSSAAGLADVQVSMERVKVQVEEAEALRKKLLAEAEGEKARAEALSSHDAVVHKLELVRMRTEAQQAIEVARAQALGEAISGMKMNLYGDTTMASRLPQLVTTAQSAQGLYEALPDGAQHVVKNVADRLSGKNDGPNGSANGNGLGTLGALVDLLGGSQLDLDQLTLGEAARIALDKAGANLPAPLHDTLQRLKDNAQLQALPVETALALLKAWFSA